MTTLRISPNYLPSREVCDEPLLTTLLKSTEFKDSCLCRNDENQKPQFIKTITMGKQKLKGKALRKIGYKNDKAKSLAIDIMARKFKQLTQKEQLYLLKKVLEKPEEYSENEDLKPLTDELIGIVKKENFTEYKLKAESDSFPIYGRKFIDSNTIHQMDLAMRLPISVKGALMPDAHVGYGLPIGGVLATKNEVIPYGVGMDIGCRMALSIFDLPIDFAQRNKFLLKTVLKDETHFGIGKMRENFEEHEVLEDERFQNTELLRKLHGKASLQIGTSGSGNHFVEFGEVELKFDNELGLPEGKYLGLLSHSGSRGMGATVAQYYTRVAMDVCKLPTGAQHLAWLDLNKAEGLEYWQAMNLAGDYAKANHDVIHRRISKLIGAKTLYKVENHHNFAWKEKQADGSELIVHRKGATPAKKGELGIIPGSMSAPGYIVSGKGEVDSLNSASHGAGRRFSRKKAKESFTKSGIKKQLSELGITLLGGGTDEAPMAYKNIEDVIGSQTNLINIEGSFKPLIVKMDKN